MVFASQQQRTIGSQFETPDGFEPGREGLFLLHQSRFAGHHRRRGRADAQTLAVQNIFSV
jgi:hypothetical protein